MPRPLGTSLQFHIRHASDIVPLDELESAPDGVDPNDWDRFCEVLELASQQVVDVLIPARDAAIAALGKAIVVTSKSSPKYAHDYWESWFEFRLTGKREASVGWMGAKIAVLAGTGKDTLVAFARPKGGLQRELEVLAALREAGIADPRDLGDIAAGNVSILCARELSVDDDTSALVNEVASAMTRVVPYLDVFAPLRR